MTRRLIEQAGANLARALRDEANKRQDADPAVAHELRGRASMIEGAVVQLVASIDYRKSRSGGRT